MKAPRGVTFIELIIAVTILAVIAAYLATAIRDGVANKAKIQKQIDRESSVRDALNVIGRDLKLAFNYRDINIELYNSAQEAREKAAKEKKTKKKSSDKDSGDSTGTTTTTSPDTTSPFENNNNANAKNEFPRKQQRVFTHFQGKEDELHFTTLSNVRSRKDQQVSDQSEVGYFIKTCRGRVDKTRSSNCLMRRTSPVIDNDVKDGGEETMLLENVSVFKVRYLGPSDKEEPEWDDDWYSGEGADDTTRNKFPWAVEVTLETKNENIDKDKPLKMTSVTALRFPNDPVEKKPEPETTTQPGVSGDSGG